MLLIEIGIGIGIVLTLLVVYREMKKNVDCQIPISYCCLACGRITNRLKCEKCFNSNILQS